MPLQVWRKYKFLLFLTLVLSVPFAVIFTVIMKKRKNSKVNEEYTSYKFERMTGKFVKVNKSMTDEHYTESLMFKACFILVATTVTIVEIIIAICDTPFLYLSKKLK